MADMLLDTTVLQDYRRGNPGARAVIEQVMEAKITASVSPLTVFRLWSGPGVDRRAEIGYVGMLSRLETAPLSAEAAKVAGIWIASVDETERDELGHYALVAATARERGEPICTSNPDPFSRFDAQIVPY